MAVEDRCVVLCLDLPLAEELRARRLEDEHADRVAGVGRALGDATRLSIGAALLDADELCVCDLAWIVERSQALVSHHVRTLRAAGLVSSRRDGKMVMYALTDQGRHLLTTVLAGE